MTVLGVIFIINSVIILGMMVYYCRKRQFKALARNVLILFVLFGVKFAQEHYLNIRSHLYELLGAGLFGLVKNIVSALLFFGGSITIGVQFIGEFLGIFLLVFWAARIAVKFLKKCSKKLFSNSITPEDEKVADKNAEPTQKCYLVLERLLN